MKRITANQALERDGEYVRGTHPYTFRSGEWGRVVGVAKKRGRLRVNDPDDPYEFKTTREFTFDPPLGTVKAEAAACRKAWTVQYAGMWAWHCHHVVLFEPIREDPENRITFILDHKPWGEQALRLRLFRPASAKAVLAMEEYRGVARAEALHADECPNCPWDGRSIL